MNKFRFFNVALIQFFVYGCNPVNTPFDGDYQTPVPVEKSYISLQKKGF